MTEFFQAGKEEHMSGIEFTEEAARRLEAMYITADVAAQRAETRRLLQLTAGEAVIDIGCGPGFLSEDIAEAVGSSGSVTGIDVSPDFISLAERRSTHANATYRPGDATNIDAPDNSFDVAVCTQVAEYIPDVDRALAEALRVLRPGGRALFVATDWDSVVWHSDFPDRMTAVLAAWDAHCAHPSLPRMMAARLRTAGFAFTDAQVFPILNLVWDDDSYSKGLTALVRNFLGDAGADTLDADGWAQELPALSAEGRYFFSICRFIFRATKGD
jgi:ubiquinone/menaquinone biosynthesis C-methylase UbiE